MAETLAGALVSAGLATDAAATAAGITTAATYAGTAAALGSAGLGIAGGFQQAANYEGQARMADFNARQELVRGQEEQNVIRENLLKTLAAQNAAYGASGVDVGGGTPVDVQRDTAAQADRELDTSRTNAILRAGARRQQASLLESDASGAILGGFGRSLSLLDYVGRTARIGAEARGPTYGPYGRAGLRPY